MPPKVLRNVLVGVQRELTYRLQDGSARAGALQSRGGWYSPGLQRPRDGKCPGFWAGS